MDENAPTIPLKKPRRCWLRRILGTLGVLILLLAVFHRVIIFGLVNWGVGMAEKSGHMQIAYQLDGTIFTSLELSKVKVRVLEPGPLKKLTLDRLALRYHPWDGLTKGLPNFIESVEVHDLDLELDATKPSPPKPKKKSGSFAIPFPRLVDIRGIRVKVETPTGLLALDNANLTLLPDQAGVVSIDHLAIPAYRTFDHLHGQTSYHNRDLILENLVILDNLAITRLQVNASKLGEQQLTAQLAAQTFGGTLSADFSLTNMDTTGNMTLAVAGSQIDLPQVAAFVSPTLQLAGVLDQLNVRIDGQAGDLATWNGGLNLHVNKPAFGKTAFDTAAVKGVITNGHLLLSETALLKGEEWVTLGGTVQLPGKNTRAHPLLADVLLSANLPDFGALIPDATGSASVTATVKASPSQIQAKLDSNLTALAVSNLTLDSATATATFSKSSSSVIDWEKPWWENSGIVANISTSALKISGYQIDRVGAVVRSTNEKANIESVEIVRGQNSVRTTGTFVFQEKPAGPLPGLLDLTLKIKGPALNEFSVDPASPIITGRAQGSGHLHWATAQLEGRLEVEAIELGHKGVALGTLAIDASAANGVARLSQFLLDMPGESFIQATGEFDLVSKDHYAAQVSTRLADLVQFKPLMGESMKDTPLAGTIQLDWNGTGLLSKRQHEGRLSLDVKDAAYASVKGIQLHTAGYYTPTQAEFPQIDLSTSKGNLATTISYFNRVLKIDNLKLTQNQELRLAGSLALPIDFENISNSEKRFPLDEPIAIDLVGKDVQLGGLFTDIGMIPPATGRVSLDVKAKGSLRNLDAVIALKMQDVQSDKAKQVQPISGEINVAIANQRANLTGNIREPSLQPITLSGSIPLELASIISTGSISPNLPIAAHVVLPPTSLAIVPRYVAMINRIDGTVGLDVTVEGTLEKPRFLGGLRTNVRSLIFRDDSLPDVRDLTANLDFKNNVLTLSQVKGDLAGGPFTARGSINLTKPAEPTFDIALQGRSILFVRNDSVIVRSNFDLTVRGPLNAAEVGGKIAITDSRFFREIDVLPINLPGRPAPAVAGKKPNLSFPTPPLRDWKFNIAIKTEDAFKVTGNLANGEVLIDLKLAGTGLAPTLDGNVVIAKLRASLPFSRLDIEYGNIYFSKDLPPLSPVLDLRGKSVVRDYTIDAYIWGDAAKPQTLFLSQPPLTQEDILTLLATGVTQTEIQENPQLLAGRAGSLFIQKYYNKIFKRKQSFEQSPLSDRIDVQVGNVDPKTGRESATARLRLTDHWQVLADLDITGGVRGQVRYLLRFK